MNLQALEYAGAHLGKKALAFALHAGKPIALPGRCETNGICQFGFTSTKSRSQFCYNEVKCVDVLSDRCNGIDLFIDKGIGLIFRDSNCCLYGRARTQQTLSRVFSVHGLLRITASAIIFGTKMFQEQTNLCAF